MVWEYKRSSGDASVTDILLTVKPGFCIEIPNDANELYFLELF